MARVLASLLRGAMGVGASLLVVAIAWTLYVKRDVVAAAVAPLAGIFDASGPARSPDAQAARPAPSRPDAQTPRPTAAAPAQAADAPSSPATGSGAASVAGEGSAAQRP